MQVSLVMPATLYPITLQEFKDHLKVDSGSFADNTEQIQSIHAGSYGIDYELLTLDVAPGGSGWAVGDTLTGATSTKTCVIVTVITTKTYIVKSRSGAFILGEVISNGVNAADQGTAYPTFATGYTILGDTVEVAGYTTMVILASGTNTVTGTNDVKIQESDDSSIWTDWTGGVFTQVTTANDNLVQEKAYTGIKRYIRTVSKVLLADCQFGTSVIRSAATSAEDDLLTSFLYAGIEHVQDITRRQLLTATWDYSLQKWPCGNYIKIPFGNLQSVTSIKYKTSDGTETIMTVGTDYIVETNDDQCGKIILPYGGSWPSFTAYPSNPITIRFICGWTAGLEVPAKLKSAIKFAGENFYMHGGRSEALERLVKILTYNQRLMEEF